MHTDSDTISIKDRFLIRVSIGVPRNVSRGFCALSSYDLERRRGEKKRREEKGREEQ
jgi:hypothetical protein